MPQTQSLTQTQAHTVYVIQKAAAQAHNVLLSAIKALASFFFSPISTALLCPLQKPLTEKNMVVFFPVYLSQVPVSSDKSSLSEIASADKMGQERRQAEKKKKEKKIACCYNLK